MKSIIRDTFHVRAETFWRDVFFNAEYQERLYKEALACDSVELKENTVDEGNRRARRLVFTQRLDAPAAIRKLFGETTTMEERGRFDPQSNRWRFEMIPDRMPDKIRITGETWVEPLADGNVERVCAVDFSVNLFGVGSLVEKFMASATAESYAKQAAFTRAFITEKSLK
jgi:hypothetical protein